jgi:hypothetical protein
MPRSIIAVAIAVIALAGCGGSNQDTGTQTPATPTQTTSKQGSAQTTVCSARADIKKQLDALSAMTKATVTVDGVKAGITSIREDLTKITSAQGELSGARKQQVEQANSAFKSDVTSIGGSLLKNISASQAEQQVHTAAAQLQNSYKQAMAPIDCSGG